MFLIPLESLSSCLQAVMPYETIARRMTSGAVYSVVMTEWRRGRREASTSAQ